MSGSRALFASDVPLHHQIYELLRGEVLDGLYVGRDDFPGEIDLSRRFGVSLATARAVLQRLAGEGLIARGKGRRPRAIFVPHQDAITPLTANIDLFTFRLIGTAEIIAPWTACRTFGLPAGTVMWRCARLRLVDRHPHSVAFSYQPVEIGRRHRADEIEDKPMPRMLADIGLAVVRVECLVEVRRPPVEVGPALDVLVWDKLLETTLTSFTEGERAVDFSRVYFHPAFQHSLASVAIGTELIGR